MMRNRIMTLAALTLHALAGCKSNGMALTERGQLFKINIVHPDAIAPTNDSDVDVVISNRGVNSVHDVLIDVQLPQSLAVDDQRLPAGVNEVHDPETDVYHYTIDRLPPVQDKRIHYRVHARGDEPDGKVVVVAWQKDLPGDKLQAQALVKYSR